MPVKIRLMRIGATKRPFYRVVAVDEQKKRTGAYIELLGTYNPLTEPKEIKLKQDRIDDWIKKGAQPSDGFLRITGKAPQRFRKPKKQQPEEKAPEAPKAEETATDEISEQTPVDETTAAEQTNDAVTTKESEGQEVTESEAQPNEVAAEAAPAEDVAASEESVTQENKDVEMATEDVEKKED